MRMEDLPHGWADAAKSVRDTIGFDYHSSIWCAPFEALYGRKCRSPVLWAEIEESSLIGPELVQETTDKVVLIKEKLKEARDHQKSYADNRRKPLEFEIKVDKTLRFVEEPVENSDREVKRLKCSRMVVVKVHLGSKRAQEGEGSEPAEESKDKELQLSQEQLQQLIIIVPEEGMNIEALQTKYPIIEWENFDRDDLVKLWDLVRERFSSTEPTDDKERALWVELKRLFEPDTDDLLEL
ncbi:hypothetical protein Tco_1476922 [Tanacetum coccineum]